VGVTRQVVDRLLAERTLAIRRLPATSTAASGSVMSCCSPRNVIVVNREPESFAQRCESQQYGVSLHSWTGPTSPSERVFTCLYRAGRGGIVREPEGITMPRPAISSERAWSKQ